MTVMETQAPVPVLLHGSIGDYKVATLKEKAKEVFITADASGVDPVLAIVKAHIDDWKQTAPSCDTKKGRDEIRSFAAKVTKSKTALEKIGKEVADEVKNIPKQVDASRRKIKDTIEKWHDDVRRPLTDWEEADEARQEKHNALINQIIDKCGFVQDLTAQQIRAQIAELRAIVYGDECEEYQPNYEAARARLVTALETILPKVVASEAEKAEIARLRQEAAEKDAELARLREIEKQQQRELEEKQKAADLAARQPLLGEQDAALKHAAGEGGSYTPAHIATVADALSQPRPSADVELQRERNRAALADLRTLGVADDLGKKIISAVAAGKVQFMTMDYRA